MISILETCNFARLFICIKMIKRISFLIIYFSFTFLFAQQSQKEYPRDYFGSPLDIPLSYAGNFCELRGNHFHAGLDIKTDGKQGQNVYATADGYISCIRVSTYGYGKVIYIDHPNGYTTVYAHLQKFAPEIEKYVKENQYKAEKYEIELQPKPTDFVVKKGDLIALSGNTGGSAGPHVHYEIRDTHTQNAYNPFLFGYPCDDDISPLVFKVIAYPLEDTSAIEGKQTKKELYLAKEKTAYHTAKIYAQGKIGLGIQAIDKMTGTYNTYGIYKVTMSVNGSPKLSYTFDELVSGEDPYLNTFIDYPLFTKVGSRIQLLYKEPYNKLSIYSLAQDNGVIDIEEGFTYLIEIEVEDFNHNKATITIPIEGKKEAITERNLENKGIPLVANRDNMYKTDQASVFFPENTFFHDTFIEVQQKGDTLSVNAPIQPLQKQYNVVFNATKYTSEELPYVCIASVRGKKAKKYYQNTYRKGNILTSRVKTLGKFVLTTDKQAPTVKALNFSKAKNNIAKLDKLKVSVTDNFSGIGKYTATINGKWVLMEYEHKENLLFFTLADKYFTEEEEYLFELTVADKVGNQTTLSIPLVYKP
ncbi:hypothetical protein HMPREF9071_0830 [Capnocytophaga sp. oral taxon 338 str. F0234]|nr:hypothetical protein HMPREF9071_0830 [Capnocytophaga sp. oral taxon 338 str. F0234]